MTTRLSLSKRQYSMLHTFIENGSRYMTIKEAQAFDQRPFRSMLIQQWIVFVSGKGFHISKKGRDAWFEFLNTDVVRKNPMAPLTSYFDPAHYKLYRKDNVQAISKKSEAA